MFLISLIRFCFLILFSRRQILKLGDLNLYFRDSCLEYYLFKPLVFQNSILLQPQDCRFESVMLPLKKSFKNHRLCICYFYCVNIQIVIEP